MPDFKNHILPHIIAVFTFLLVVTLFFNPVLFENKTIYQNDILQWEGAAHELREFRNNEGEEGLWASNMFGGMPAYLVDIRWGNEVLQQVQSIISLGLPHPVRITFLCFLCYYIMLLSFRVRPYLAIGGALCFGLSSYMMIGLSAGHNARIAAIAFMPLVLAGVHLVYEKKWLLGAAVAALGLALQLRVNHLQITYYLAFIILIYFVSRLIASYKDKDLPDFAKGSAILTGAALLAVATFFGELWGTYEYSQHSIRGKSELADGDMQQQGDGLDKGYAFAYSNGIFEPLTLFIPNFFGGSSQQELSENSHLAKALRQNNVPPGQVRQQLQAVPTYWGEQPLTAPYYMGAIIVFLFLGACLVLDKRQTVWLIVVVILGIVLSWGSSFTSFNYFMFDYFPGYNKFRSVTFALVLSLFALPLGAMLGLEKLIALPDKTQRKKYLIAFAITGGFALLAAIFAGMGSYRGAVDAQLANVPGWFLDAIRDDRASLLRADAFRTFIFTLLTAALIWLFTQKRLKVWVLAAGITVLILVDTFPIAKRYLSNENFQRNPERTFFAETAADAFIKADAPNHYRVFNLQNPWTEARTAYHHASIGGYHGAKMGRYQDLISNCLSEETERLIEGLQQGSADFENLTALNMLNARYIKFGDQRENVIENPAALGSAWFVSRLNPVTNAREEMDRLCRINPKFEAVYDASTYAPGSERFSESGSIQLVEKKPHTLIYESENEGDGFAVFSEVYYAEGWEATIDGNPAEIARVNYTLRGLEIPAGTHTIAFHYRPQPFIQGNTIMSIASWLLILSVIAALGLEVRNNIKKPELSV